MDEITKLKCRNAQLEFENRKLLSYFTERSVKYPDFHSFDPYVSAELTELRIRTQQAENVVKKLKENSTVTNFSTESVLGQRLLDKCTKLLDENEKLGTSLINSRITQLEIENNGKEIKKTIMAYALELEARVLQLENEHSKYVSENSSTIIKSDKVRRKISK